MIIQPTAAAVKFADANLHKLVDDDNDDYHTFDEWAEEGYYVVKGEKASAIRIKSRELVFHSNQVEPHDCDATLADIY
jgi:hypothetical protein